MDRSDLFPAHETKRRWSPRQLALTALLALTLALGVGSAAGLQSLVSPSAASAQTNAQSASVADVVEKTNPAVVTITTMVDASELPGAANGNLPRGEFPNSDGLVPLGTGSGFIVDAEGHVVTNNHVVASGSEYLVTYINGKTDTATLVGADPFQDVAVLKIDLDEGETVPDTVSFGDSDTVRPGDEVIAIGTPYGEFNNTVSEGMVGAVDRGLNSGGGYSLPNLIQHDAEIYPGNSGGPLLNMDGEVIGINVAKAFSDPMGMTNDGFNFAIESNAAKGIVDELIKDGNYERPYLGISAQASFQGVQVMEVEPDGPAAKAGLQPGDIITGVQGEDNQDASEALDTILFDRKPGDTVTLDVLRNGESTSVTITLGERPTALPQ
jgi:serine protease Do